MCWKPRWRACWCLPRGFGKSFVSPTRSQWQPNCSFELVDVLSREANAQTSTTKSTFPKSLKSVVVLMRPKVSVTSCSVILPFATFFCKIPPAYKKIMINSPKIWAHSKRTHVIHGLGDAFLARVHQQHIQFTHRSRNLSNPRTHLPSTNNAHAANRRQGGFLWAGIRYSTGRRNWNPD